MPHRALIADGRPCTIPPMPGKQRTCGTTVERRSRRRVNLARRLVCRAFLALIVMIGLAGSNVAAAADAAPQRRAPFTQSHFGWEWADSGAVDVFSPSNGAVTYEISTHGRVVAHGRARHGEFTIFRTLNYSMRMPRALPLASYRVCFHQAPGGPDPLRSPPGRLYRAANACILEAHAMFYWESPRPQQPPASSPRGVGIGQAPPSPQNPVFAVIGSRILALDQFNFDDPVVGGCTSAATRFGHGRLGFQWSGAVGQHGAFAIGGRWHLARSRGNGPIGSRSVTESSQVTGSVTATALTARLSIPQSALCRADSVALSAPARGIRWWGGLAIPGT